MSSFWDSKNLPFCRENVNENVILLLISSGNEPSIRGRIRGRSSDRAALSENCAFIRRASAPRPWVPRGMRRPGPAMPDLSRSAHDGARALDSVTNGPGSRSRGIRLTAARTPPGVAAAERAQSGAGEVVDLAQLCS
jgi:hypothetical protein